MKFRNATLNDLERIVEIYNSTIPGRMVTADTDAVTVASRTEWLKEHQGKRPLWVFGDLDDRITGWVSFKSFYGRPAYNATAEISIYIDEAERGKGLGREVLRYSLGKCGELGIKNLMGFIFAHNEPSLRLFKHAGFEQWANLPLIAELDGVERSLIIMGKRI
jgi:L-amino acid N-acyltransferase YncA